MKRLYRQIEGIVKKGLLRVLSASVLNKVFALISNVLIVRILSKSDYGYYSWAYNIITIFLLFSGLGITTGVLQFCSEDIKEEQRQKYYKFGLIYGICINTLLSIGVAIYVSFFPLSMPEAKWVLLALVLLPIFDCLYNYALSYLRSRTKNKQYAHATNIHSFSHLVLLIAGAYFGGLPGYIAGYYVAYFVTLGYVLLSCKEDIIAITKTKCMQLREALSLIKYSLVCACNNGISHLLYVLDVFLIGVIMADENVIASYKASTTIPTAMYFITSSILLVVYPYFARHQKDKRWVKKNASRLLAGLAAINVPIGAALFFGAPLIVDLVYGAKYADAVPIFRVLAIGYIISTAIRIPCGHILSMLRKIKVNLVVDIIAGIANIILDVWLIQWYGSIGAAYATVCVMIISSICSGGYFWYYLNKKDKPVEGCAT